MKKIKFYVISNCKPSASINEFNNNICTIVTKKKHIGEYVSRKAIKDHKEHYIAWLKNHNLIDNSESRNKYLSLLVADQDPSITNISIRQQTYSSEVVAAVFRMFNKCAPVGCSYEIEQEKEYYSMLVEDALNYFNEQQKIVENKNS